MTEKNIMVIPARKRVGSTAAKEKIKKLANKHHGQHKEIFTKKQENVKKKIKRS